jgi:RNA polymerase sigma-70 factor (ECF subfamily)
MNPTAPITEPDAYAAVRPRLFAIAYRMLGTRADAEDVLQDAWLRWCSVDPSTLQSAEAWLVTVVTRLAIDRLRAAKAERQNYVGWWLSEPLVEPDALEERTPETVAELASELSVAILWVLERLSPEERAAFLLRQAFDYDYDEIAGLLGKSEAACRQMVHRAAERVRLEQPRFTVPHKIHRGVLEKFIRAAQSGERAAIQALLADQVQLVADGGGKVPSFLKMLRGADNIAKLYSAVIRRFTEGVVYRMALINGEPGLLRFVGGQLESAQAFVTEGDRIAAIYVVRNPDKLAAIDTRC